MESKHTSSERDYVPSAAKIVHNGSYNQTYVILKADKQLEEKSTSTLASIDGNEVLFACGNWCYHGRVQFGDLHLNVSNLPVLIPTLQKQQQLLRYYCNSTNIPPESSFSAHYMFMQDCVEFFAKEMLSPRVDNELRKMSSIFSWIDDDSASTYFELSLSHLPHFMENVSIIASKTYSMGLVIIAIYFEHSLYFVIQDGEGDQPLLDVRFPDVSQHGQGLSLATYSPESHAPWSKLTLWHILFAKNYTMVESPKIKTISIASSDYLQTYCVMKSVHDPSNENISKQHDAFFRFGSWCYSGSVSLIPTLALHDIPFVIPALRIQQSRLNYLCDVGNIPTTSPFAAALKYIYDITPMLEIEMMKSESILQNLVHGSNDIGIDPQSLKNWLEGDASQSFFEFKLAPDSEYKHIFTNIELIATKSYQSSGVVIITIVFQDTIYLAIQDSREEFPLLDSKFPDVSGKGRGYQIINYDHGLDKWPILRKLSIWQTTEAMEKDFQDKAKISVDSEPQTPKSNDVSPSKTVSLSADTKDTGDDYRRTSFEPTPKKPEMDTTTNFTPLRHNPSTPGLGPISVSRPHHLPKADNLSKRLEELRKNLGTEGVAAPWDSTGKPLGTNTNRK